MDTLFIAGRLLINAQQYDECPTIHKSSALHSSLSCSRNSWHSFEIHLGNWVIISDPEITTQFLTSLVQHGSSVARLVLYVLIYVLICFG